MAHNRSAQSSMSVWRLTNIPETWLRPGLSQLSCTDMGTTATSGLAGSSSRSLKYSRSAPAHSAKTTSLTLTPNRLFTFTTSSKLNCANAILRSAGTSALNTVGGAVNGAAIAWPVTARLTVSTAVDTVAGTALAICSGRVMNLTSPPAAISSSDASPGPSTGSGGGASGSKLHNWLSKLVAVTPSTAAWCTLTINASCPPSWGSVPATPSITHISQTGLLRSSGIDAM